MSIDEFLDELWARIMFETMDMDKDQKYLVRGLVKSVMHDMKETDRSNG